MAYTKVNFKSKDGLLMTADYYSLEQSKGLILLCHRSHCNRAEYRETAPKFNQLGYACLAIDQRSGMKVFGEVNETKNRAKEQGLPTGYLMAKPDIAAAIDYAYQLNNNQKIILLGSSYSAALSLLLASSDSSKLASLLLYSPMNCLKGIDLIPLIKNIDIPVYISSPIKEIVAVKELLRELNPKLLTHFEPKKEGFHGSKILWEVVEGYQNQWQAVGEFLLKNRL